MGQCGCGDFQGDFKFKGPGDIVYVLQVYLSCDECDNPAGVIIYKFSPEDCILWDVKEIPELDVSGVGSLIGVVDPKKLVDMWDEAGGQLKYLDLSDEFRSAVLKEIKNNKRAYKPKGQK